MSKRIHVLINGEKFGPYPEAEFRQHLADTKILSSDLAWREGLSDWIAAGELLARLEAEETVAPAPALFEQTKAAAAFGDPEQQFRLALLFEKGEHAPRDPTEAMAWLRRAASQDHALAQFQLSLLLAVPSAAPERHFAVAREAVLACA